MTKNRECGTKVGYQSKKDAADHKFRLVRSGAKPGALNIYKCPHCGKFHVGHAKRRRR